MGGLGIVGGEGVGGWKDGVDFEIVCFFLFKNLEIMFLLDNLGYYLVDVLYFHEITFISKKKSVIFPEKVFVFLCKREYVTIWGGL